MSHFPFVSGQISEEALGTIAFSAPQNIVAHGTPHNKGSWVELIASTTYNSSLIGLSHRNGNQNLAFLYDIGIGAAASEKVIIPNVLVNSNAASADVTGMTIIPYHIPSGTRVAARCQATVSAFVMNVGVYLIAGGFETEIGETQPVVVYGDTPASTTGTNVDSGGTVNTKGSYSQLTASTTQDHRGFFFCLAGNANTGTSASFLIDIAVGAAASEKVILPDYYVFTITALAGTYTSISPYFPIQIPSGTRLSIRSQCSTTTSTDRQFDAVIYGVN